MPPYWQGRMGGFFALNPLVLIDFILLCGVFAILVLLLFVALPYVIALILLMGARYILRLFFPLRRGRMW